VIARESNQIPDNQEVSGILHPLNDADLVVDTFFVSFKRVLQRAGIGKPTQLVVVGKRNREIAVELGVSVKSVEWHVSHILRKLAITSRTELADALAQPRQPR